MNWYNGYDDRQRNKVDRFYKKKLREGFEFPNKRCAICDDPDYSKYELHSEDYSEPINILPPASYVVCEVCHRRLHRRFNEPISWRAFLEHVKVGGYGWEYASKSGWYSLKQRKQLEADIAAGELPSLPRSRARILTGSEWWLNLTLDPDSLYAAWALPRPLRPYPDVARYASALAEINPSDNEIALLRFHAAQPCRSATMREISQAIYGADGHRSGNIAYGKLAHRLCDAVGFAPDRRKDGTAVWMSTVAEEWQPIGRELELVMVPALAAAVL